MAKNLVIVESPAKCKTIGKFLGNDYVIKASYGHIRDLPAYRMAVNTGKNFEPTYELIKGKEKLIKELKSAAEKAAVIFIATDPDREGEAIAWHIKEALQLSDDKLQRIEFNEITEHAILEAIQHRRTINSNLVDAQQARRVLDRLIGYKLSPILAKKIQRGLSAGRVQSASVKIIYDREKEILQFKPQEYWVITVTLTPKGKPAFQAKLIARDTADTRYEATSQSEAADVVHHLSEARYHVDSIEKSTIQRKPPFPFITSTLQQDASKKFNWSTKKTMIVAQQLYEGVDIKGESVSLITYMRTDSIRVSDEAKSAAQQFILSQFGKDYLGKYSGTKKKKGVQDAHEAIRPTYLDITPKSLSGLLDSDHLKLYQLIWDRFIASQMSAAQIETTQIIIQATSAKSYFLRTSGQVVLFDGFTRLYTETVEDNAEDSGANRIPMLTVDQALAFKQVDQEQKFTQPPSRYTEASLVKEMEEKGIGRPSTYAPIISIILDRQYVKKEKKRLVPTELGMLVTDQLIAYFHPIVDLNFTADMENKLDEIMEGKHVWQKLIQQFYDPFSEMLSVANQEMKKINQDKPTDAVCEKCGHPMVIKAGRFGEFMACSNYPTCKNTRSLKQPMDVQCPLCQKPLVEKKSKRGKIFYGCSGYPGCTFAVWDKPIQQACPKCGYSILVEKQKNHVKEKYCSQCQATVTSKA